MMLASMTGLVRNQFGFQQELERALMFNRVSQLAIRCRENCDDYAGAALGVIDDIADSKFRHGSSSGSTRRIRIAGVRGL
jgi:hypothetical protein